MPPQEEPEVVNLFELAERAAAEALRDGPAPPTFDPAMLRRLNSEESTTSTPPPPSGSRSASGRSASATPLLGGPRSGRSIPSPRLPFEFESTPPPNGNFSPLEEVPRQSIEHSNQSSPKTPTEDAKGKGKLPSASHLIGRAAPDARRGASMFSDFGTPPLLPFAMRLSTAGYEALRQSETPAPISRSSREDTSMTFGRDGGFDNAVLKLARCQSQELLRRSVVRSLATVCHTTGIHIQICSPLAFTPRFTKCH